MQGQCQGRALPEIEKRLDQDHFGWWRLHRAGQTPPEAPAMANILARAYFGALDIANGRAHFAER